jgi:hypothetical protein
MEGMDMAATKSKRKKSPKLPELERQYWVLIVTTDGRRMQYTEREGVHVVAWRDYGNGLEMREREAQSLRPGQWFFIPSNDGIDMAKVESFSRL